MTKEIKSTVTKPEELEAIPTSKVIEALTASDILDDKSAQTPSEDSNGTQPLSGTNDFLENPDIPLEAIPGLLSWVISYYQTMSDAPKAFLFSSVLMTFAAVIGNKVYYQLGRQKVKPNLYMLLLAGSTVSRKSTAVSYTVHCLNELERRLRVPFLMPDSGSLEGMIEAMREPREDETKQVMNAGIACYSEFASFLDNMKKEYNKDFQSFVIDVYDGNRYKRQLKKEFAVIENPCISIFGGITMAQFGRKVTEEDKHSGFLQRFLIAAVPTKTGRGKSLVQMAAPAQEMEERLIEMLENVYTIAEKIRQTGNPFVLSAEAQALYQESYDADQDFLDQLEMCDPALAGMLTGYHGRLDIVKIKIAMIFQTIKLATTRVQDEELNLEISSESMKQAIAAVGYYWRAIAYLIKSNFNVNHYAQKLPKVLAILKKNKGDMTSRELQKAMGKLPDGYYQKILQAGIEVGVLTVMEETMVSGQKTKRVRMI